MAPIPADDFPLDGQTATDPDPFPSGEDAAAAGDSSGGVGISHGGLIAIIVVVCVVAVLGIGMSVLYYLAKKREWQLRDKMRRSARRVVAALTPRRSEFPRNVKDGSATPTTAKGRNARMRLDDVPPTPKLRPEDVEKAMSKESSQGGKGRGKRWPGHLGGRIRGA